MTGFTVDSFIQGCKSAMAESDDAQQGAAAFLRRTMDEHDIGEVIAALDAAIPADADIGEMVIHTSPELTLLYGRVPPRLQTGIHNHTVFACIAQLVGAEVNTLYEPAPDGDGLRQVNTVTVQAGQVIELPPEAIHSIENPNLETGSALHVYGGDFKAVMDQRSLWTSHEHQEVPFSFEALLRESVRTMVGAGNQAGLEALAVAIPSVQPMIDSLVTD